MDFNDIKSKIKDEVKAVGDMDKKALESIEKTVENTVESVKEKIEPEHERLIAKPKRIEKL